MSLFLVYSPSIITGLIALITALRISVTGTVLGIIVILSVIAHTIALTRRRHKGEY